MKIRLVEPEGVDSFKMRAGTRYPYLELLDRINIDSIGKPRLTAALSHCLHLEMNAGPPITQLTMVE